MKALVRIVLADPRSEMETAWRRAFADRSDVSVVLGAALEEEADAWVVETKRGDLDEATRAALGHATLDEHVETRLRADIRGRFGGSLPADFAVWLPTGLEHPRFVIAVCNNPRNPHGVDDPLRVALSAGAALQAVHMQNALEARSIKRVVLPALGPASVSADARADLMWTAHALYREAEMPDFPTMRRALAGLLVGVDPDGGPGAYKRAFGTKQPRDSVNATLPDKGAATAQLRRKLESVRLDDE